ncbi:unnamed protein product [Rhizoctonia solani]|uniref:Protein kinase domain-containing protein n=1 Tax=Rhizoctonia solani TaxID=456999 RepID=A0A8H3BQ85_9AGAM|nr:unnamed protein product [Rhizoctonia solani]
MDSALFDDSEILSSPDKRSGVEERWVTFQPYLLSKGYRLRPRYQPDWVPSWKKNGMRPSQCEDSVDSMPIRVLDAVRTRDELQVIIKMIIPSTDDREGTGELAVLQHFSSPSLKNHPANHIVPCLDSFPIPGTDHGQFIVMPLLGKFTYPPFYNLAEVHDCLQQVFDGLLFMHENNVAHCDIAVANIMMDLRPLFDEPFHPVYPTLSPDIQRPVFPRYRRSEKGIRYYYIDLGYAKWFQVPSESRLIAGGAARERAPEQFQDRLYDPFVADVYQLGMVLSQGVLPETDTLRFLEPLVQQMIQKDPSARPVLTKARQSMNTAFLGLSGMRYRWPLVPREAGLRARGIYFVWGVVSEIRYWLEKVFRLFLRARV